MNFIGFIDRLDSNLRTACFEIAKPPENYACIQSYDALIRVGERIFHKHPKLVDDILQFLASTYIDRKGLGYFFGQGRKRGKEAVTLSKITPTASEIMVAILMQYRNQFDDESEIPDVVPDYSEVISDEDIIKLTSDITGRKSTRKTSKRIKLLKKFNPRLMEYHLERSFT